MGLADVLKKLKGMLTAAEPGTVEGLKQCALHLVGRAKALAPRDTGNLQNSIHSENEPYRTAAGGMKIRVGVSATNNGENYALKTHENMTYQGGPNVGGAHTQRQGEGTERKGLSAVEPSDGSAGGKYLERPIRNPQTLQNWQKIIGNAIKKALAEAVKK